MERAESIRKVRMLMTLRLVTITTLLICAFGIELLVRPTDSLRPLFLLAAFAYGTSLIYPVLDRWLRSSNLLLYIQLVGDALLITLFVQITGGVDSPMSFIYLLPIGVASMLLYREGGLIVAFASWLLYAGMIVLADSWAPFGTLVPLSGALDTGQTVYLLLSHLVAMTALALLTSYLSVRLRVQGDQLAERQQAVARLQALNENIIESINSGLITTDLEGQINFINRGGSAIIDYEQSQIEGSQVTELLGFGGDFLDEIRKQLTEKRRYRFERDFTTAQGREIFLGIAVSNLRDKAGHPLGYILIFQDLTEIQALEQEVRLKERMAALGEMAAGMAHELRNPLAAISGSVQYLKGSLQPQGETLDLMDIILREGYRLDNAIRDFLTFAKPGEFSAEEVDVARVLDDNVKLLRKSHELREGHRIHTEFQPERIPVVLDPNRLKQVFWNLATNALKAMPDGGTLTIAASLEGDELSLRFTDQGVGMSANQRESYFQPFKSSFREGTGLGAAIVYRLVEEHDGRILVRSEEGSGTCVEVRIPRRNKSVAGVVAPVFGDQGSASQPMRAAGGNR